MSGTDLRRPSDSARRRPSRPPGSARRRPRGRPPRSHVTDRGRPPLGTSPAALARHYDLPAEFFALWLGSELVYSCGQWDLDDPQDTLERAQHRKIDRFATALEVRGGRVLDVGCGWGGTADRLCTVHGAATVVGLTPSPAQAALAAARTGAGVTIREESWVDHEPDGPYDAVVCIEASEHFARDGLGGEEKVAAYRAFFGRAASWLRPGGRLGLQAICLDNAGPEESVAAGSAVNALIRSEIFPESMSSSLSELVLGWETDFRLESFVAEPDHYVRTFQAWSAALRAAGDRAEELVGPEVHRRFVRYFAASRALFRLEQQTLYRIVLSRRPEPKRWVAPPAPAPSEPAPAAAGATGPAVPADAGTRRPRSGRTTTCRTSSTPCGSALRCPTRRGGGRRAPRATAPRRPRRWRSSPTGSASPAPGCSMWGAGGRRSSGRWSISTARQKVSD